MSDEEHQFESKADAGASKTFPQQAGTIRKNGYIVIKNRACKVVEVSTSKTGKHGHAKCHFVAIDIFNGKKLEDIVPSSHNCDVPHVNRTDYQLIDISEDGFVSLLTENGGTKDDLKLPTDDTLLTQLASSILCDERFLEKLKDKFYRVAVRLALLYGTDCWATKKTQARKLETAEMRMLRWMCGHTRLDRIRNEVFREKLGVACISDKLREGRLRWFGHVRKRQRMTPVQRIETLMVEGKKSRGRPRLTWDEQIRHDLLDLNLSEDMNSDRSSWRCRIKVRDF